MSNPHLPDPVIPFNTDHPERHIVGQEWWGQIRPGPVLGNRFADHWPPRPAVPAFVPAFVLRAEAPTRDEAIECTPCGGFGDCGYCDGDGCGYPFPTTGSPCRNGTCTVCRGSGQIPQPGPLTDVTFVVEPHLARLIVAGHTPVLAWIQRSIVRYLLPLGVDPRHVVWTAQPIGDPT